MLKNKFKIYIAVSFTVLFIPGILLGQGSLFLPGKQAPFPAISTLTLFEKILPFAILVIIAAFKSWFLQRKLSLPREWKSIEKLGLASLAETWVEGIFLVLLYIFFAPGLTSLLRDIAPLGTNITPFQYILSLIIVLGITLPYQLVVNTLLCMLLIRLLVPVEKGEDRRYLKYAFISGLVNPMLSVPFIFLRFLLLIFKSS